jgi:hypothetical protein
MLIRFDKRFRYKLPLFPEKFLLEVPETACPKTDYTAQYTHNTIRSWKGQCFP